MREGTWWDQNGESGISTEQESLLSECFDVIFPTLLRMTGNRETALDLTQDALLKAWEKKDEFEGRSNFSTWVYRIAVNLTLNHLRRAKRMIYTETEPSVIAEHLPEERAQDRFEMASVREAVLSIAPHLRVCLVMHYFEERQVDEIAKLLGIPRGTAAWRLHSGRKKLKEELTKRGIGP